MLDIVFISFFQAVAGDPATQPIETSEITPTQDGAAETSEALREIAERNREVCRVERTTGSRLRTRVCMSAAEAAMLEREAEDLLQDAMRMYQNGN